MGLQEQVYSVLVVSSSEKFSASLLSQLPPSRYEPVFKAGDVSSAKRLILERDFDFVIVSSPLSDDAGVRFAIDCSVSRKAIVLLLVKAELHEEIYDKVCRHGVFTLTKPMSLQTFQNALRWMETVHCHLIRYREQASTLEDKMKAIRLVNKAKWLLISNENMDEEAAHKAIEKAAMDRCLSRQAIAQEIIDKYPRT